MTSKLCCSILAALCLACWAGPGHAQDVLDTKDKTLETVTVTANKTRTDKQKLPAAVSAFDGYALKDMGLDNLNDVVANTPNINFNRSDSHTTQYVFRGIGGTKNMNRMFYVNLDDVAVPYAATDTLLDVERIEILRGGQGALYGANTHTGLINVITREPEFGPANGYAQISVEKFGAFRFETAAGGRISDTVAYRIAAAADTTNGYFNNQSLDQDDTNDSDQFTGRFKFLFLPNSDNQILLSVYADQYDSAFDAYGPIGSPVSWDTYNDKLGENTGDILSPTLKWKHDLGNGRTLTSITNYTRSTYGFVHDWDFTGYDMMVGVYDETFNVVSQEFKVSGGDKDSFQWLAGVFGRYQTMDNRSIARYGTATGSMAGAYDRQDSTVDTSNLAGYGQVIYRALSKLEVTCALRLDYEKKELEWSNISTTGSAETSFTTDEDWMAFSPSVAAAWLLTDKQRIYATVARGFKAGDYNYVMPYAQIAQTDPVDPEYTLTYEMGYKSRHFNDRLEFNADLFYVDWSDMQVDINIPGTTFYKKLNAADAHSSGLEIEARFKPLKGWTIFGGIGYMFEYEFDAFTDGTADYTGNKLPFTNDYTVNLGTTMYTDCGFFMGMDASWRGAYYLVEDNATRQDSYVMLNAKVGYAADHWEVAAYGRNLLDECYAISNCSGALMAAEPLTVGVMVKINL
ncbi:TonB-dependent receptor domain-containing protein [uncultured Desulfobacter sp.]|uniref:TonB-dependent receptor n=1 Tax=uncultured Desulfobacter sp. TaxID=240139 RepID=UPI0029F492AA|nr:TonB-dependent receptor [uncultured Desulfobacter sp.]